MWSTAEARRKGQAPHGGERGDGGQGEAADRTAATDQGEGQELVTDAVGDGVPAGVGDGGHQDRGDDERGHEVRSRAAGDMAVWVPGALPDAESLMARTLAKAVRAMRVTSGR